MATKQWGALMFYLGLRYPHSSGRRPIRLDICRRVLAGNNLHQPISLAVVPRQGAKDPGRLPAVFCVIYGLLLGLLAVATYQNHTDGPFTSVWRYSITEDGKPPLPVMVEPPASYESHLRMLSQSAAR
jgi:hypothetical protein